MSQPTRYRILLVDDSALLREGLARYLRDRGCDVETAAHGLEGLDRLAHGSFDLVVSDFQMPLMDGLAFLRHALDRDPSLRHRFLLCSAMPARLLGPDPDIHFLLKPFTGRELWAVLERLLGTTADRQSTPAIDGR